MLQWQRAIREDASLQSTRRLVALTASTYGDTDGTNIYPGAEALAAGCGLNSEQTVRRHLEALVSAGYLVRERRGGRRGDGTALAAVYRLAFPTGTPRPDERRCGQGSTGPRGPDDPTLNRSAGTAQPVPADASTGIGVPGTYPKTNTDDRPDPPGPPDASASRPAEDVVADALGEPFNGLDPRHVKAAEMVDGRRAEGRDDPTLARLRAYYGSRVLN